MGRPAKLDPPISVHLRLPTSLVGQLQLLLWSDAHGKIPLGKLSEFCEIAVRKELVRLRAQIDREAV